MVTFVGKFHIFMYHINQNWLGSACCSFQECSEYPVLPAWIFRRVLPLFYWVVFVLCLSAWSVSCAYFLCFLWCQYEENALKYCHASVALCSAEFLALFFCVLVFVFPLWPRVDSFLMNVGPVTATFGASVQVFIGVFGTSVYRSRSLQQSHVCPVP